MKSDHPENNSPPFVASPPDMLDPVVEEALSRKLVSNRQVADAWLKRKTMFRAGKQHPVWRWLAEQDGVDGEAILNIAAQCYDYLPLDVPFEDLKVFVHRIIPCFSQDQWKVMLRTGIIPVKRTTPKGISSVWNFAASDPTSKAVHNIVQQYVGKNYVLFQADRKLIARLFAELYLTQMELPRKPGGTPE